MELSQRDYLSEDTKNTVNTVGFLSPRNEFVWAGSSATAQVPPVAFAVKAGGMNVTVSCYTCQGYQLGAVQRIVEVIEKFERVLQLEPNWDSYGAAKISRAVVNTALSFLVSVIKETTPTPDVVPLTNGGVQIEWHVRGIDLEIEIDAPGQISVSYFNHQTKHEIDEEICQNDLSVMAEPLEILSNPDEPS